MRLLILISSVFLLSGATVPPPKVYKPLSVPDGTVTLKGKPVKIIVIDTGFDSALISKVNLCPGGHKSFVSIPWDMDMHGHGTNIVGLIAKYARADYCVVIYNYWNGGGETSRASTEAWQAAADSDADVIVYSGGGLAIIQSEKAAVKKALLKGKTIFAAAGNETHDLDDSCNFYPACYYKRIVVVGNLKSDNTLQDSSSYGKRVDFYANGVNALALGKTMTGTSQANAIVAGKLVAEIFKEKNVKGYQSPFLVSTHGKKKKKNVRH